MKGSGGLSGAQERILSHLAPLSGLESSYLQPRHVTQDGIARAVGIARNHVPGAVNGLIERGLVRARRARVDGFGRRRLCYFLTGDGFERARSMVGPGKRVSSRSDGDGVSLVGRRRELAEMGRRLRDGPPVWIVEGERGVGKSALLKRFAASTTPAAFYWSLRYDGSLKECLASLAASMPDRSGRLLAYVLRTERGIPFERAASILADSTPQVVLVLDDAGYGDGWRELATLLCCCGKARLVIAGERVDFNSPGAWRMRLGPLGEKDTFALAKRIGAEHPGSAYERSGGKPSLVVGGSATRALSRAEAAALRSICIFGRPAHIGEIASMGVDYQTVTSLASADAVVLRGDRVRAIDDGALDGIRAATRRRLHRKAAGAILKTWSGPEERLDACAHLKKAGDGKALAEVLASDGERMLKAGFARELADLVGASGAELRDREVAAKIWTLRGNLAKIAGRWDEALDCFGRALEARRGRPELEAEATARIASVHLAKRDLQAARRLYERAETMLPAGHPWIGARISDETATLLLRKGDTEEARVVAMRAASLAKASGSEELSGLCEATLGNICLATGDRVAGAAHYERALSSARRTRNVRMEGTILNNLGALHYKSDDVGKAIERWRESVDLLEERGDMRCALALANLSLALSRIGDWTGSKEAGGRAVEMARAVSDRDAEILAVSVAGDTRLFHGDSAGAMEAFRALAGLAKTGGNVRSRLEARLGLSMAALMSGDGVGALGKMESVASEAEGERDVALRASIFAARVAVAARDLQRADDLLKAAASHLAPDDSRGRARLFRLLGVASALKCEWYVATRYLEDSIRISESLMEGPEAAVARYDLAIAMERMSVPGARDAMEGAKKALSRSGVAIPPPASDWSSDDRLPA